MMDIDILPVQRLDFRVFPLPWPFAADRRTEIEDYFTHLRREKPQLWNGRVLLLRDFEISDATLQVPTAFVRVRRTGVSACGRPVRRTRSCADPRRQPRK